MSFHTPIWWNLEAGRILFAQRKKKALHFFKEQAVFAKKVRIPAQAGKPFLKPSYDYVEPSIIDRVKKAMKEP